jgi:predicted enzyme related to lactoylglutathione lyase
MHGQFIWYELTTPDVAGARKFYPSITGWGTQQFDRDYVMWTVDSVPMAGIFHLGQEQRQKGIPPNWMPYVAVDSVDESARKVALLGGRVVHGPAEIPGTGRFAVVQDPQGATFGIYKAKTGRDGWDGTPRLGHFSWHELMTLDYNKAFEFYRQVFGWEKTGEMDMGPGGKYFMFGKKSVPYGGMYNRPPEMSGMSPFWMLYVNVRDVHKAVETATKAGAFVKQPPMEIPGGMIAILGDPQGAGFAVHAVGGAMAAPKPLAKTTQKPASRPKAKATASRKKAKAAPAKKKTAAKKKAPARKAAARKKRTKR